MDVDLFSGESDYYNNKLYMRDSSRLRNYVKIVRQKSDGPKERQYLINVFNLNWSWIDKYVDGAIEYINDNKQKFEKLIRP